MRSVLLLPLCLLALVRADLVECENGDRFSGQVLTVDETQVKLQNEVAGVLTIPRGKVSTITFGAKKPAPRAAAPGAPAPLSTNLASPAKPFQFDASAVEQVQNQFLGDAGPEATQMFQEMIRGLMSGKLDLGDIRAKAQTSLQELKSLQKDLGDDAAADLLNGYAGILENFIKQAPAPASTNKPPAAAKPSPPAKSE